MLSSSYLVMHWDPGIDSGSIVDLRTSRYLDSLGFHRSLGLFHIGFLFLFFNRPKRRMDSCVILLILAALRCFPFLFLIHRLPESKRSPVSHYRSNVVTAQARNDKKHRAVRITTLVSDSGTGWRSYTFFSFDILSSAGIIS